MPIGVKARTDGLITAILAVCITASALACGGKEHADSTASAVRTKPNIFTNSVPASTVAGDEGPIMSGDHAIIRTQAVGPLRVGEWRRPVMSFVYAISARAGRDSEDIIVVHGLGKDTATLTFDNDTLRRVFVNHLGPHTASGIGVGTPFATVTRQPGARTIQRGAATVATIAGLCGVEFATDSVALSTDSAASRKGRAATTVRAISVGYCTH